MHVLQLLLSRSKELNNLQCVNYLRMYIVKKVLVKYFQLRTEVFQNGKEIIYFF